MSQLLLVRHGQARFLEDDYDRLSPLGFSQARALGEHWRARGWTLDRLISGPRRRQRETARTVAEVLGLGEPEIVEELDEYPADDVLRAVMPVLLEHDAEAKAWAEQVGAGGETRERGRALDRLLRSALSHWAEQAPVLEAVESYALFSERARRALTRCLEGAGRSQRVAAFASAGIIGRIVGEILEAPTQKALELGWMLENSSVCEVLFTPGRIGLVRYNDNAHLSDPAEWTRR